MALRELAVVERIAGGRPPSADEAVALLATPASLVPDLLATVVKGLGIDPAKQNTVDTGRPIRIVDPKANPIKGLLG